MGVTALNGPPSTIGTVLPDRSLAYVGVTVLAVLSLLVALLVGVDEGPGLSDPACRVMFTRANASRELPLPQDYITRLCPERDNQDAGAPSVRR